MTDLKPLKVAGFIQYDCGMLIHYKCIIIRPVTYVDLETGESIHFEGFIETYPLFYYSNN